MAVCDEHILYQSLNALLIWDFLKVFFKENIKVITYCGSCILILLHTCMLWWFHVRMNTNYARYRPEHISDDVLYMTNKTVDIQFTLLFLYLYKYVITATLAKET
jgi:hypothetical protein